MSIKRANGLGRQLDDLLNDNLPEERKKGATMIRKVALMHVLREAFPDDTAGLYIQEEIPEAQAIVLPEAPIEIPEAAVQQQEAPAQEAAEPSAASALFGE